MNAVSQHEAEAGGSYAAAKARVRAGADALAEAAALRAAMTVGEKLGCLDGDTDFWPGLVDMVSGGYYRRPFPAAAVPRLGFPGFRFTDGPRGIVVGRATCFPVPMARGASFDPALEERIGEAIGIEARLQGADFFGGVCVNLLRHPAWGRAQETYGEDPFHVGEMGAALARGVQRHVMACVKHFACNSIENARFRVDVSIEPAELEDVYLPHFHRVVREGVASVMTAYNAVNGEWCGQSRALIEETLRRRWGFDGIVISDFVYGIRDAAASLRAGLDVEMPFRQQRHRSLHTALDEGRVAIADVDAAVLRVLHTVLRFDARTADEAPDAALLAGPSHRALARQAAADSIVLLRNRDRGEGPLLPLRRDSRQRIALLGRLADVVNLGDGGSSNVHPPDAVTARAGLAAALPGVAWTPDPATADLAIVVAGCTVEDEGEYTGGMSSELFALMPPAPDDDAWTRLAEAQAGQLGMALGGDRRSLRLRAEDEELILRTAAVQPRTVVVMMGGSAIVVEPWIEAIDAVLMAWYPGMEGGHAIADVLTGAVNPSGRLPFAIPLDETHLAAFDPDAAAARYDAWHGQWMLDRDGHVARFPYGFGLAYTTFALARARAEEDAVVVDVRNTGPVDGRTVVFLMERRGNTHRVIDFAKILIEAGQVRALRFAAPHAASRELRLALHANDPASLDLAAARP